MIKLEKKLIKKKIWVNLLNPQLEAHNWNKPMEGKLKKIQR
jgi:hypothetical protein